MYFLNAPTWLLSTALFLYLIVKVQQHHRNKHSFATRSLILLFFAASMAMLFSALDGLELTVINGYRYGYTFALIFQGLCNVGLLLFATEIYVRSGEKQTPSLLWTRILFSAATMINATWGGLDLAMNLSPQTSIPLMLQFGLSFALFITVGAKSYKLAKRVTADNYKKSITYIGHFAICVIGVYICYIGDALASPLGNEGNTEISFLGAILFVFLAWFAYVGFVKPMQQAKRE